MYFDYQRERNPDFNVYETNTGFATYYYTSYNDEKAVYIEDIYVAPEYRNAAAASLISKVVQNIAIEEGCLHLLGTVDVSRPTATDSLRVLLAHGMTVVTNENNLIWFTKEL